MKKYYLFGIALFITTISFLVSCSEDEDYIEINDVMPIATDDVISSTLVSSVDIPVLQNDTTGDAVVPSTVSIVGGTDTNSNGTLDELTVANQGTWKVNATTGVITFTPLSSFVGNPTQISYNVKDYDGNTSNNALVTINASQIVTVDLTQVPYPKLSDYHFFIGDMKNQIPSLGVLPYLPSSVLFSDYAHKKRFVWMPAGSSATYNGDAKVLELPVGSVLIKTFYYDNVQNVTQVGATRIIETRVMIRKSTGWVFADYVWNAEQTEAFQDLSGSYTNVSWIDEGGSKSTNYRIPSEEQCIVCHKKKENIGGNEVTIHMPIGIKPQNLNFNYNYGITSQNQLLKWVQQGYLQNTISLPSDENTVVDYNDTSKSLELRVRSYVDSNCSHCHSQARHCDYRPMKFDFASSYNNLANMGVCVSTEDMQDFDPALDKIVNPGSPNRSMMYYRLNTTDEAVMMPLHGRTLIHQEGVNLVGAWINSLQPCQ
jgi:uncharacterized repeat protein (TIGR03806 family)